MREVLPDQIGITSLPPHTAFLFMPKRFTDSNKWDKIWFRKLKPVHKCLWFYICDRCDHAGIWEVDLETASYFIGEPLILKDIENAFEKQYLKLNGGIRWLLKDFLVFQYGQYDETNKMFKPIQSSLNKYGVSMGDIWGINPLKVQVQDKVKVKDKEGIIKGGFTSPTHNEVLAYQQEINGRVAPERFLDFYESKGWMVGRNKMKNWKAAYRRASREWEQKQNTSDQKKSDLEIKRTETYLKSFEENKPNVP